MTQTRFLFSLGFGLPVLAFAFGLWSALGTTPPEWTAPPEKAPAVALPDPTYLPLDEPLQLGLAGGRLRLSLNLAFSARLAGPDLLDLGTRIKAEQPAIMAALTEAALREATRLETAPDLAAALRAALPAILRATVNDRLGTEALPTPVEEVLVLDIAVMRG